MNKLLPISLACAILSVVLAFTWTILKFCSCDTAATICLILAGIFMVTSLFLLIFEDSKS